MRRGSKKGRDYSAENARRDRAAQRAGFKNRRDYYRAVARNPAVREALAVAGIKRGADRYRVAGLADSVTRFRGRSGGPTRAADVRRLAEKIKRAGGDPGAFFKAIGSPKKKKK